MSTRSIFYLVVNGEGHVISQCLIPKGMFPPEIAEGTRIVVPADGKGPSGEVRVDLRKLRKPINHIASLGEALTSWRPEQPSVGVYLDAKRQQRIAALDQAYAERMAELAGPLASLHAEKRRQAEAGGGSLVSDDADRLAILENAARQDALLAELERQRRSAKAQLRAAATEDELDAVQFFPDDKPIG